ncbi:MAG: hypothetical protein ACYDHX_04675 [Methanothrix sp.]
MNKNEQTNSETDRQGYMRRISNGERLWLRSPLANVAVAARIIGDISEKDLRRALGAVRHVHPLLGVKVIFDDHHDAWFSTDEVLDIGLRIVARISETQWFDEIRHEHRIPFKPEIGPLSRSVLVYTRTKNLSAFAHDTKNVALTLSRKDESGIPGTISTNLGRLDFPLTFGDLQIERIFFVPTANSSVRLILGGVSVGGKLVFSLNYAEETGDHNTSLIQDMIRVRNRALEYLGFPEKANDNAM